MKKIISPLLLASLLFTNCSSLESLFSPDKSEFGKNVSAGTVNSKFIKIENKDYDISDTSEKNNESNKKLIKSSPSYASLSAHFFDASKRVGISTYETYLTKAGTPTFRPRYLAEEQPDIAYEVTSAFQGFIKANKGDSANASANLASSYLSAVSSLTKKSETLNIVRTLGYRMNEGVFNHNLNETIFCSIIETAQDLQTKEFTANVEKTKYEYKTYQELNKILSIFQGLGIKKEVIEEFILAYTKKDGSKKQGLTEEDRIRVRDETNSKINDSIPKPKKEK